MYSKSLTLLCIAGIVTISFCCSNEPENTTTADQTSDSDKNMEKSSPEKRGEYLDR